MHLVRRSAKLLLDSAGIFAIIGYELGKPLMQRNLKSFTKSIFNRQLLILARHLIEIVRRQVRSIIVFNPDAKLKSSRRHRKMI